MYDLKGKVALITGAGGGRGMGRAIALRLAEEGADIVANDVAADPYRDRPSAWGGLTDLVKEIEAMDRRAVPAVADITDSDQVDRMVRMAVERLGHIDILVNNAASRHGRDTVPVVELDEDVWDEAQRVNVKGTFLCSRAVGREMVRQGNGGKIINIASIAGKHGVAGRAAYCTSKFAVIGLTQCMALEMAPYRVNVNAICPGVVDTQRIDLLAGALAGEGQTEQEYRDELMRQVASETPLGRVAHPSDIARMAAFLASSEADYLTGLSVTVSGGSVMD